MTDHGSADSPEHRVPSVPAAGTESLEEHSTQRGGQEEQFSAFYRTAVRRLVAFLMNQGASLPTAADIAQETMIKAYQRWTTIRNPQSWVHTVASRELVRRIADVREEPVEHLPTSLLSSPSACEEWEARRDELHVLRSLPPRQRQVLAWTLEGYTPLEIAEQLQLTPDAVRSNLKKARRAAAEYLQGGEEEQ